MTENRDERLAFGCLLATWLIGMLIGAGYLFWGTAFARGTAAVMLLFFGGPLTLLLCIASDDPNDIFPGEDGC